MVRTFVLLALALLLVGCCACVPDSGTPSPVIPVGAGTVSPLRTQSAGSTATPTRVLGVPTAVKTLAPPLPTGQPTGLPNVPPRVRPTATVYTPPATVQPAVTPTLEGQP